MDQLLKTINRQILVMRYKYGLRRGRSYGLMILLALGVVYFLTSYFVPVEEECVIEENSRYIPDSDRPVAWFPGPKFTETKAEDTPMYKDVKTVLGGMGYLFKDGQSDWDLGFANPSLFMEYKELVKTFMYKPSRKINIMPGLRVLTHKVDLLSQNLKYMPKTFKIPRDNEAFIKYRETHPKKKWLTKTNEHKGKGVKIFENKDLATKGYPSSIQEFIEKPFLVHGRKFDLGVYIVVTSINPLRLYMYNGDFSLRYCPEEYYPFDFNVVAKNIIQATTYLNTWQVPEFKEAYEKYNLTNKDILYAYIRQQGYDTRKIDEQIREAVYDICTKNEQNMLDEISENWEGFDISKGQYFEIIRFDFLLDESMKLHLLEVNAGPGLGSQNRPQRSQFLQHMLTGFFHLVGTTTYPKKYMWKKSRYEQTMKVSPRDVSTYTDICVVEHCITENCAGNRLCDLCAPCLSETQKETLAAAFLEHTHKYDWRRLVPKPFKSRTVAKEWRADDDKDYQKLLPSSQWMFRWFHGKCMQNVNWCM